jgi:hypothetical protein
MLDRLSCLAVTYWRNFMHFYKFYENKFLFYALNALDFVSFLLSGRYGFPSLPAFLALLRRSGHDIYKRFLEVINIAATLLLNS